SPIAAGEQKQIAFTKQLVDQQGLEHSWIGIEQQGLDERLAATLGGCDPLAERELVDPTHQHVVDGPPNRRWNFDVHRQADQIRPVEVMNELDRVRLRSLLVTD